MKKKKLRDWLIIYGGTLLFRLWFSTCRVRIEPQDLHDRYITGEGGLVGATWHRNAVFLVWFFRKVHPMIMFSRSNDGDLLAGFARKLGVIPVRGSSSAGGREALDEMRAFLRRPGVRKAATVLDGPRGPRCRAKRGMLVLAQEAGVPLLPIMMSADRALTLKRTWDRTLIPLPFSRIAVSYAPPWHIPADAGPKELERLRKEVETTLNRMMAAADTASGYIVQGFSTVPETPEDADPH